MSKGLLGGMTDYSHQSFDDIVFDLKHEYDNISAFIEAIEKGLEVVEANGYWRGHVPFNFKSTVAYSLKHYKTSQAELLSISEEIQEEVAEHHCKRLQRIAKVAREINSDIGKDWHQDYDDKDYENKDFRIVERIYCDTRDMAVNLLDISNIANRLVDFIGKKQKKNVQAKTKILLLTASPSDETRLRVDVEMRKIDEGLQAAKFRESISIVKKEAVKIDTITKALLETEPDIVHFSGHGDVNGVLVEDEKGQSVYFPIDGVKRLFSLFKKSTKCVVLNACYSEEQAKVISEFGIFVVGMNKSISDEAAIVFSTGFYQAIGSGKDIPFAFEMGMVLISQFKGDADIPVLWKDGKKLKE